MIPDWIRAADDLSVSSTALALGLSTMPHRTFGPCPACQAATRGHADKRGPIGLRGDIGWRCHRCQAGGRALTLVAWAVTGQGTLRKPWSGAIRAWLADKTAVVVESTPVVAPPPIKRAPVEEVDELWARCGPPRDHVAAWLSSRGLVPDRVADLDLVRWLPADNLPAWAAHWPRLGCWAVVPLVDHLGRMRSLQGRAVTKGAPKKSVAAQGISRVGLVFASGPALAVLRSGARRQVVIAEGEPDYLTWACRGEAVIGIPGSGAWSAAVGQRLTGCDVIVRVHEDDAGRSYVDRILPTLQTAASVRVLAGLRRPSDD